MSQEVNHPVPQPPHPFQITVLKFNRPTPIEAVLDTNSGVTDNGSHIQPNQFRRTGCYMTIQPFIHLRQGEVVA